MINLKEATKILNSGEKKYSPEEIIAIRDFLYSIAQIEYETNVTQTTDLEKSK